LPVFLARKLKHYLEKDIEKVRAHTRFVLRPAHFAIILKYVFWLFILRAQPTGLLPTG
jgi:hypothetical protein